MPVATAESRVRSLAAHLAQILAAFLGGLAFHLLGVPAAWLSGAMIAVVVWRAFGFGRVLPRPLADAAMLVSGASMGASVTPEAIAAVARYPVSLALLALAAAVITGASALWLVRMSGWRRDDALLASVPGALSTVLAIASDRKAAVESIAVVQSFRLFVLVMILPSAVAVIGGSGRGLAGLGQPVASPFALALALAGGLALGIGFERLRVAAPILLGGTLVSTGLHVSALAPGVMPPSVATAGLVLVGIFVAERFRTLNASSLRRTLPAAAGSFLISLAISAAFAALAAVLARVGFSDALVAFAPGGVEAMMVLSLVLGLDPFYVGIHHVARFVGIGVALPLVFAWVRRPSDPSPDPNS